MEQHPHLPSGPWEGFYIFGEGPGAPRHVMHCQLQFQDGQFSGQGRDDVGPFVFFGRYNLATMICDFIKQYLGRHQVVYRGHIDELGIWGHWFLVLDWGGFHLWPVKAEEEAAEWACGARVEEVLSVPVSGLAPPKTPCRSTILFR